MKRSKMRFKVLLMLFLVGTFTLLNAQTYDSSISGNVTVSTDEGEAHIAINPIDSSEMVMGYMELSTGALDFKIYHSSNAGNSWQISTLDTRTVISTDFPSYSIAGGGDIIFAYDNNGDLYCSWINLLVDLTSPSPLDTALWVSYWAKSTDNGATFTLSNGADRFFGQGKVGLSGGLTVRNYLDGVCDRQWMAVDLTNGTRQNDLYIAYINYPFNAAQTGLKVKVKGANQTAFSAERTAYLGSGQLTNIGVDSNGVLHYSFCDIASNEVYHTSSSNGGTTFSAPHLISSGNNLFGGSTTAINGRENSAPSLAIDGTNKLHLVWGDFPANQTPDAYYSSSTNGGVSWSTRTDLTSLFGTGTVFMPVVSSKNNHVTIGAYVLDTTNKAEYYIVSSSDNGVTFSTPVKVSSGITDFNAVGTTPFIGDYSSSVRTNCNIYSLWTDCRNNGCKQYIAKYNECLTTGVVELTPVESSFELINSFPVPANDHLNFIVSSEIADELLIEFYNGVGQRVLSEKKTLVSGKNELRVELGSLKSGMYTMKLTNKSNTFVTRSCLIQ